MHRFLALFIAQLAGFLVGGIPFGYLVARAKAGIDIREHGSGNIGATNVGRVLGFRYFILVFLLDFLKGVLPVLAAVWMQQRRNLPNLYEPSEYLFLPEAVGMAVILGHMFPIYLQLRGGKGVATSIGVLLVLAPKALLAGLVVWLVVAACTRMVSLASVLFAFVFALAYFLLEEDPFHFERFGLSLFVLVVAVLVVVRHRQNLGRIINGTEPAFRLPWQKAE